MKKKSSSDTPLVWSSTMGRICVGCGRKATDCNCKKKGAGPAGDGIVRVQRETKGRGGKTVTVITGIPGGETVIAGIAGDLKRRCGSGGTVKDGIVEIQGEHRDTVVTELEKRGFKVKRAGG